MLFIAEERGKARAGIEAREAEPIDGTIAPDQSGGLAIADQGVVFNRCHNPLSYAR